MAKAGDKQTRSENRRRDISIHVRVSHAEYLKLQNQLKKQTVHLNDASLQYSKFSLQRLMIDAALNREIKPVVLPADADICRLHELAVALEKNGGLLLAWHKGKGDHFAYKDKNKQFPLTIKDNLPSDKNLFVAKLIDEYENIANKIRNIIEEN